MSGKHLVAQAGTGPSAGQTKAVAPRKEKVRQHGPLSGRFARAEGTKRKQRPAPPAGPS